MYIDTHTHIHYPEFDAVRTELIDTLTKKKIYTILVGTDVESSKRAIEFTREYIYSKATVGFHPNDYFQVTNDSWKHIEKMAHDDQVVGIGETGIDVYRDQSPDHLKAQTELFHRHIELSKTTKKPLVIHSRDAFEEVEKILGQYQGLKIIFHCFTGNRYWLERLCSSLSHEVYFSFSGIVTFKNKVESIQEAAKIAPMECILTETDSPYLAPVPYRGQRNDSTLLPYITDFLADLRQIDKHDFSDLVFQNAKRAFQNL
jgi:TatD DNase family protein